MKKILFISLAVVLGLSVGLIGCGGEELPPEEPESIVIGLARDVDEDLAFFDWCAGGPVYRYYDELWDDPGIHLSAYDTAGYTSYVPVDMVVRDFSLAEWDIGDVTEALIDEGADFIWGGPGTAPIYSQGPVCNANGVLLFGLEGGASEMVWEDMLDDWPYVWLSLSFANWYEMPVLSGIMNAEVDDPKAYVVYINDTHGYEYRGAFKEVFGAENVVAEIGIPYNIDKTQADTIIQNAITALGDPANPNYDIFCGFCYPWLVEPLTQASIDNNFNPPAIVFGPGANFGYYAYSFGDAEQDIVTPPGDASLVEGIMCFAVATSETEVSVGTPTMSMADMYNAMMAQLDADVAAGDCLIPLPGALLLDYWGYPCYVASAEMWKYAVEEVGDLDSVAIRNALAEYSPSNPAQTVFGDTWYTVWGDGFGGGIIDYKCHTGEIGQWQNAAMEVVGYSGITNELPNHFATADIRYPMTDQWGWIIND